ncbi:hypothetical protein HY625_01185 [Candidatus Uhrbacteria bacterium]|nr:hypothetical protein [Candidatus Uhrbacteria bacterium]
MKTQYKIVLLVVPLVLILVAAGIYGTALMQKERNLVASYQAVFLANGQVYFGRAEHRTAPYVTLTDIYYLQSRQPLQEPGGKKTDAPAEPELTLVKLGDELHGPTDRMEINRDQILFIEDLRENGKVVQGIKQYAIGKAK